MKYSKEEMTNALLQKAELDQLAEFFKVFSDPTRLKILQALSFEGLYVSQLCDITKLAQSTVSHQLSTLRKMRIVKATKIGTSVFYELEDLHIMNVFNNALIHIKE